MRLKQCENTVVWPPLKSSKSTPDLREGNPDLERVIFAPPSLSKIGSRGPFKASKNRFVHRECGGAATTEVRGEHTEETIEQHSEEFYAKRRKLAVWED